MAFVCRSLEVSVQTYQRWRAQYRMIGPWSCPGLVDTSLGRDDALGEESTMQKAMPEEFRRRAVELTRQEGATVPQIAKDLGISDSCLRRWIQQAEVEEGTREGLTSAERKELVELIAASDTRCIGNSFPPKRGRTRPVAATKPKGDEPVTTVFYSEVIATVS